MTTLAVAANRSIADIVNGLVVVPESGLVTDVQVDSRSCSTGSLFVALRGKRTDGHNFVDDAFRRGSSLCIVSRLFHAEHKQKIAGIARKYRAGVIAVEDPLYALQALASVHMQAHPDVDVIGITGSNGKTTTKDLLGEMLSSWAPTAVSPGNLNSDIGLPLACFQVGDEHTFAVFELGINRKGEMDELVSIVRPRVAAITNIGTAHMGPLGSRSGIAVEKRRIFSRVCPGGRAFVDEDDEFVETLRMGVEPCLETFGPRSTEGVEEIVDRGIAGSEIVYEGERTAFTLPGRHNVRNAMCAISIARHLGVPASHITNALENATPGFARGEIIHSTVDVYFDCYNANRQSVLSAIDTIDSSPVTGRKILVLGSIKELGDESDAEHELVGRAAAASTAHRVFFFGEEAAAAFSAYQTSGGRHGVHYEDFDALSRAVADELQAGDLVLIKGSRSLELERLLPVIDPELEERSHEC